MVGVNENEYTDNADVTDISAGGLQFKAQKHYSAGDILFFNLNINAAFLARETEIIIKECAVVRWCREEESGYAIGVEFMEITEFTRSLIMNLVQRTIYVFGDEHMHTMFR